MPDLWELPDEELWGQLDASLLEDQFRASEAAEWAARIASIPRDACAQFARVFIDVVVVTQRVVVAQLELNAALRRLYGSPSTPPERPRRTRPHGLTQPRTLHLALQANARPVLNCRTARREWRKQGRG